MRYSNIIRQLAQSLLLPMQLKVANWATVEKENHGFRPVQKRKMNKTRIMILSLVGVVLIGAVLAVAHAAGNRSASSSGCPTCGSHSDKSQSCSAQKDGSQDAPMQMYVRLIISTRHPPTRMRRTRMVSRWFLNIDAPTTRTRYRPIPTRSVRSTEKGWFREW